MTRPIYFDECFHKPYMPIHACSIYIAAINQIVQYQLLVINFENKVYKIFKCKTVIGPNKGNKNTNTTSVGLILHSYIMLY